MLFSVDTPPLSLLHFNFQQNLAKAGEFGHCLDMLVAKNLVRSFGNVRAVKDVSFTVEAGEVVGFLGTNGAGKTTSIKMLAGVLRADQGQISICEIDPVREPKLARARIGYLPEGAPLYRQLTPRQMLRFVLELAGHRQIKSRIAIVLEELELSGRADQMVSSLSKGYQRRTALALALANDPKVLLLDEPFDGFDPVQKKNGRQLLRKLASDKAILICTHSLSEAEALCDRILVLHEGELVASGSVPQLLASTGQQNLEAAFCHLVAAEA
jgi:ABC-2 type transport system ATP-binding protein